MDLKGKTFQFTGPLLDGGTFDAKAYRGRVVLVAYWSTWCTVCTQDVPVLKDLYKRFYRDQGLEIVGVNLDVTAPPIAPYIEQHKIPWPQVFQPGGTESEPAMALGIIVPPVMILVDRQGQVTNVTTNIDEIKTAVPELMGDRKSRQGRHGHAASFSRIGEQHARRQLSARTTLRTRPASVGTSAKPVEHRPGSASDFAI